MKKFFGSVAAVAIVALAVAAPASAATINLAGAGVATANVSEATVDQVGAAVNVNVGEQLNSIVDQSVLLANNLAMVNVETRQDADGALSGNGSLSAVVAGNVSVEPVTQIGLALNGAGDLDNTDVTQAVTALNNAAIVDVLTVQK